MLLAIDPGKRACGAALFEEETLLAATLVELPRQYRSLEGPQVWKHMSDEIKAFVSRVKFGNLSAVIIEQPGAYRSDNPYKTLILQDLIAIGAFICASFPTAILFRYRPTEWKGSMNKEQTQARAYARLNPFETQRIYLPSAKSKRHNVWDSVAIGLHHLGRFKPRRSYARK